MTSQQATDFIGTLSVFSDHGVVIFVDFAFFGGWVSWIQGITCLIPAFSPVDHFRMYFRLNFKLDCSLWLKLSMNVLPEDEPPPECREPEWRHPNAIRIDRHLMQIKTFLDGKASGLYHMIGDYAGFTKGCSQPGEIEGGWYEIWLHSLCISDPSNTSAMP